jgi:hypothetical protein
VTRASDAERERALRDLQRHYAAGRLDTAEFEERAALATRARSRDELRALFADLPRQYGHHGARVAHAAGRVDRAVRNAHLRAYAMVNGALVGLWALTGAGEFWPVWSIAPWGVGLASHLWCSRALQRRFALRGASTRQRSLYP